MELFLLAFSFLQEKSSRLSTALFGEDCEISHEQVYELLKYAALGKCYNVTQPRYNTFSYVGINLVLCPHML